MTPLVIDTPLVVVGHGPAPLVVAKVAGGWGLPTLLAGHEPLGGETPVALTPDAVAELLPHGVLDILRPYLAATEPPTIAPAVFEDVLKHHCIVDLNITVYDRMQVIDRAISGRALHAVLTDGRDRWELHADAFVDASTLPTTLPEAIIAGAERAREVLRNVSR